MSQRFIRCVHCGLPHDVTQSVCPATGKAIDRRRYNTSSVPVQRVPVDAPPPGLSGLPQLGRPRSEPPPPNKAPPVGNQLPSTIPPKPMHRDLIGKTIGSKYLVRSVLGEGGMGAVFEAENLVLGRMVAVKVLHPAQAKKKVAVKRFHQEARAAGAIGHPNICEVYDLGTLEDGAPYLVMERLVGETLADRIASEGGLPFDDVIDILTQVLSGLVAAHEKGIVHRDIKPENVFLTKRVGCPPLAKLLDFGVSKMISPVLSGEREEDLDLTRTGMVMGTPFYMSPEQARGDRNLDARVDLYACGVMLYEALTGKRPFTAANYNALLLQILTTKPRPARELRPALPMGFDELLDKALARSRDERFQSAAEFQRDLQALRDRHPKTGVGMDVTEIARQAAQMRRATPLQPFVPLPPRVPSQSGQTPAVRREELPRIPEPTPSSVEIPILFSDTPLSGEQAPDLPGPSSTDADATSDSTAVEDLPTEVATRPHRERMPSTSDTDTTERRVDLVSHGMGKRPRAGNLRQPVAPRPAAAKPATPPRPVSAAATAPRPGTPNRPVLDLRPADTEIDDNNATLIQASPLALPRRKAGKAAGPSPDDTIRMDGDGPNEMTEARDRVSSNPDVPRKVPR